MNMSKLKDNSRSDLASSGYFSGLAVRCSRTETDDCTVCVRRFYGYIQGEIIPQNPELLDKLLENSLINDTTDVTSKQTPDLMKDAIIKSVLRKSNENSAACEIFLDILDGTSWKGIKALLLEKLEDSRQNEKLTPTHRICKEDILRYEDTIIDYMHSPIQAANFMYERKDLETVEHDEIIYEKSYSLQVRRLLNIVNKKGCFDQLALALEHTDIELLKRVSQHDIKETIADLHVDMDVDQENDHNTCALEEEMDVEMTFEFDSSVSNGGELCQNIVSSLNTGQGEQLHRLQGFGVDSFHHTIQDIQLGSIIIIMTPILTSSTRQFQKSCGKDSLCKLVKLLLSDPSVIHLLPHEDFKVHLKITSQPVHKAKQFIDNLTEAERTFRHFVPYIAELCHPSWLMDKTNISEANYQGSREENPDLRGRRAMMISLLKRIFHHGPSQLTPINTVFQDFLGQEVSESLIYRCPYCTMKHFLENYKMMLREIDGRMITLFQDIVSSFEENRKLYFPEDIGRKDKVQRLLQFAMECSTTLMDLANVLSIYGRSDLVPFRNCQQLTSECTNGKNETDKEKRSLEMSCQICRTFTCRYKRKDSDRHAVAPQSTNSTSDAKPFIFKVTDEGVEYEVEMRSRRHMGRVRDDDDSEATFSKDGNIIIAEPTEKEPNRDEAGNSHLRLPPESGYFSKSSSLEYCADA